VGWASSSSRVPEDVCTRWLAGTISLRSLALLLDARSSEHIFLHRLQVCPYVLFPAAVLHMLSASSKTCCSSPVAPQQKHRDGDNAALSNGHSRQRGKMLHKGSGKQQAESGAQSPLVFGRHQHLLVLCRRCVPAQVLRHAAPLQVVEALPEVSVCVHGIPHGVNQPVGFCSFKGPASTRVVVGVVGLQQGRRSERGRAKDPREQCRQSHWQEKGCGS
jgi:hypothetical protein